MWKHGNVVVPFSLISSHDTRVLGDNYIYAIECHRKLSFGWFISLLEVRMEMEKLACGLESRVM